MDENVVISWGSGKATNYDASVGSFRAHAVDRSVRPLVIHPRFRPFQAGLLPVLLPTLPNLRICTFIRPIPSVGCLTRGKTCVWRWMRTVPNSPWAPNLTSLWSIHASSKSAVLDQSFASNEAAVSGHYLSRMTFSQSEQVHWPRRQARTWYQLFFESFWSVRHRCDLRWKCYENNHPQKKDINCKWGYQIDLLADDKLTKSVTKYFSNCFVSMHKIKQPILQTPKQ